MKYLPPVHILTPNFLIYFLRFFHKGLMYVIIKKSFLCSIDTNKLAECESLGSYFIP